MPAPTISVAMSVHDSRAYLAEAIESVLAQTFVDFEFLIVDDGSSDGSAEILDEFASRDSRIVALHQENRGLARSLNRIIERTQGTWIARIDSDDVACPDRFERQLDFLRANPDHGIVGSNAFIIDEHGQTLSRSPVDRPLSHAAIVANLKEGVNLHHPTIMVSTALMQRIGGYRVPFRYAQDYDLYLRLSQHTKMANLPDCLIRYRVHSEQASTRHLYLQTLSAVIAWLSHEARLAGRPDPIEELDTLPQVGSLDELFGVEGADAYARRRIVERIIYSPDIMARDGFDVLVGHIRDAGPNRDLWRVVPRLAKAGYFASAARLGAALARA